MKLIAILSIILLAGCAQQPTKTSFPDVPEKLMAQPKELKTLDAQGTDIKLTDSSPSKFKLSEISSVITTNYGICNEYREQIFSLQN